MSIAAALAPPPPLRHLIPFSAMPYHGLFKQFFSTVQNLKSTLLLKSPKSTPSIIKPCVNFYIFFTSKEKPLLPQGSPTLWLSMLQQFSSFGFAFLYILLPPWGFLTPALSISVIYSPLPIHRLLSVLLQPLSVAVHHRHIGPNFPLQNLHTESNITTILLPS